MYPIPHHKCSYKKKYYLCSEKTMNEEKMLERPQIKPPEISGKFLLSELFCGTPPSCLKVIGGALS